MRKYKLYAGFLSVAMACSLIMPVSAEDYSDTEAWYAKCSQAQTSQAGVKACQGFQEYQKNRKQSLQNSIEAYTSSIASLQSDTTKMEQLAKEQKELVTNLQTQISEKEKSIEMIEKNIEELETKIKAKEEEIEAWNEQIETRMKNEQTTIGTNMIIDLIMGSDSLSDMLRRISGVERITEDDQSQIKKLNKLKKEHDMSILLVSHDLDLVKKYADKVILIDKTILKEGTSEEVFQSEEYKNVFGK